VTDESQQAFRAIDLTFHDLRHEAGSRLLESGWPLHHVQEMLGHANLSQTSTYLNGTRIGLQESMQRFDSTRAPQAQLTRDGGARSGSEESSEILSPPLH